MRKLTEYALIFITGACVYSFLESLWRGYTHWSMAICGGACLSLIFAANNRLRKKKLALRALTCAFIITGVEFLFGCVFNILLDMSVWDYSSMPLNLLGQVCLYYTALWFVLSFPAIKICSLIHEIIFAA